MKVLVTGATGFMGGHLVAALLRGGYRVRALVRDVSKAGNLAGDGVELAEGDIRDVQAVDRAVAGVALVFHVAAAFRIAGKPGSYYRAVNVDGTRNIINAARRCCVERVVHCSTVGVHGHVGATAADETAPFNPGDIYQQTKLEGERLAATAFAGDVRGVIFRPGAIYGPGDMRFLKLFRAIKNRRFAMLGKGTVHYHLVYVHDLVDGIILCGTKEKALGRTYILAGERSISLKEFVRLIAVSVGADPPRMRLPLWPVMAAAHVCELACKPLGISPPLYPRRADFFRKHRAFRIDRARRELGFAPAIDPAEGLKITAQWYFQQGLLKGAAPPGAVLMERR